MRKLIFPMSDHSKGSLMCADMKQDEQHSLATHRQPKQAVHMCWDYVRRIKMILHSCLMILVAKLIALNKTPFLD